jgi:hypothetical protein
MDLIFIRSYEKMGIKDGARVSETLKIRYASGELPNTPKQLEARSRNMAKLNNNKIVNVTHKNSYP